jgi:hypothetical protein
MIRLTLQHPIESLEFHVEAAAPKRGSKQAAIGLRFIVAVAPSRDGQRAAPSCGPPTVAPAKGPATPRKVGALTSHRRPSASAEPPASGTTGASFQSRPTGCQGRRSQNKPSTRHTKT